MARLINSQLGEFRKPPNNDFDEISSNAIKIEKRVSEKLQKLKNDL